VHYNGLNSIRATQTGLSRNCHRLCRKHLDMLRWFVFATFMICVHDFPCREVSVKVGVIEFGLFFTPLLAQGLRNGYEHRPEGRSAVRGRWWLCRDKLRFLALLVRINISLAELIHKFIDFFLFFFRKRHHCSRDNYSIMVMASVWFIRQGFLVGTADGVFLLPTQRCSRYQTRL